MFNLFRRRPKAPPAKANKTMYVKRKDAPWQRGWPATRDDLAKLELNQQVIVKDIKTSPQSGGTFAIVSVDGVPGRMFYSDLSDTPAPTAGETSAVPQEP